MAPFPTGSAPPLGPAANPNNCFELNGAWVVGHYNYELDNASMPACTKNVVIPAAINGLDIVGIDNEAFMEAGLTSVVISDGIETIGDRAFYGNNLTTAIIPQSVTWIGDDAFKENNLTEVKIVANSVWGTPFDLDVVITYY